MNLFNKLFASILSTFVFSSSVLAQHALIDRMRPSSSSIFVTQAIEGEYGSFKKKSGAEPNLAKNSWRGYGVRSGVGLEVMKFTQFSLSHTMLSLRSHDSSLENIRGSRLAADVSFTFSAPLANIQFGLGATAAQLDYQNSDQSSSLLGSGYYQTMGFNYFVSSSLSIQVIGKRLMSHYSSSSGSALDALDTTTDNLSLGFSLWM